MLPGLMKTSLEPLEGNKVKLSVEVEEAEFDRAVDDAFRKLAREVRIPGFRPGKAPRRVLEARIGTAPAREQALRDAIPRYLADAVREHEVDIIATPEVDITQGTDDGPVAFDATIEVRPQIIVPGYAGLRVEVPSPDVSDDDIQARVDALLRPYGELADIDRPVARGDYVTVDVAATRDDEPVAGLTTEDWLYEVGRGWVAEPFDLELIGSTPGDELAFTAPPSGTADPADFQVVVKKAQELHLPELTDEWVQENLDGVETVDEWRARQVDQLGQIRLGQARQAMVDGTTTALAELVDDEVPDVLVDDETRRRAEDLMLRLRAQGVALEEYLAATGQDPAMFAEGLKDAATRAVKVDLALRAVAAAESIEATDEELDTEIARIALQVGQKPAQVRKAYERNDAMNELGAELRKRKALEWLLEHVEIVDPDGKPVERSLLIPEDEDGHDREHDHDHEHDDAGGAEAAADEAVVEEVEA
jgi:trigger factor